MSYIFYSFSNGTKENDKKEALLFHSYIKRNPVPRLPRGSLKGMYLSKFVSCQILILVTKSCAELLDAGFTNNGVYKILFNNSQVFDVYCDQSSRGGGNIKKDFTLLCTNSLEKSHLKTYALKEEKCSFPSVSFDAIFSGASKVILDIFYFALLCCVIGPQNLRHFFNRLDLKFKPITLW